MRTSVLAGVLVFMTTALAFAVGACAQASEEPGPANGGAGGAGGTCSSGDEICNGVDDDCDGEVDETCACVAGTTQPCYPGPAGTEGVGTCVAGTQSCAGMSWGPCNDHVVPTSELCNMLDDDCNGMIDDGDPEGGLSCVTGLGGPCAPGIFHCIDGALICEGDVMPAVEVCNNLDDDCNGMIDDGDPGGGDACDTGVAGACAAGTSVCFGGQVVCDQLIQPTPEQCNNVDDDCDGTTDENNPGGGAACSTGQPGICAAGTLMCSMGVLGCVANNMPAPLDLCGNNLDDNCDGVINDGCAMCGPSTYDCDLLAVNGCECNFGTGCCGSVCQYTHNAGFGASYYDCSVPGTYTSGQGLKACEATDGVGTCTFGTCAGFNVVCSSASANCKCWNVDGAAVGRAYDAPGNTCQCVTSPSSGVAWD